MNLLFLTPQLPYPPRQGTALRNWGLIRGLSARHKVSLVSFVEEGQAVEAPLAETCRRIWTVPVPRRTWAQRLRTLVLSSAADMARRLASVQFSQALGEGLAAKPDAVQVEGIELAPYLSQAISALRPSGGRVVYDAHNAETLLQRTAYETDRASPARWPGALYSFVQARRLARLEAWTLRQADLVLCVSEEDARWLRSLAPACRPVLIPNGIHLADYDLNDEQFPMNNEQPLTPNPSSMLLFTGKMDYRPNVDAALWFAKEVFPRVRDARPEAQFVVAGQRPHPRLNRLARQPGVVVTGAAPDLRPYLARAVVYVAPLRMGGGTRFKLLEAMAMRKAIVSTRFGAEGFSVAGGREMLLADTPADFAMAVLSLLEDEGKRQALGRAARRLVEQGYDWSEIVPRVEAAYQL